ncbi:hypothetical protein C2845_PM11G18150 [Panicum miliaceum]|uniref:Protein kinase domain-containing protein n=1 Tax=Panicum miliaceum TaxID=4540 RepID=A0A3L6RWP9_PANMI|nr:hypothetical protein C2845_PM11G18150 [Panicum miliaceum]
MGFAQGCFSAARSLVVRLLPVVGGDSDWMVDGVWCGEPVTVVGRGTVGGGGGEAHAIKMMGLVGENMDIKFKMLQDITNNFANERKIGSGGYGTVYKGLYHGHEIAVKRLGQLQGLDDTAFDNEFRNLFKIRHPNIVRLIGYCHESQRKFIPHEGKLVTAIEMERVLCFEYVEGGNLQDHLSAELCGLDWPTCFTIIKGICEGLHHLHRAQGKPIYHLDLKPANILLDKMMTAKIGDLGLSRLVSSTITHKTEICKGTLGYMPPEYIHDGAISKKFDVFSLGVVIIKIMDGINGMYHSSKMPPEQFIQLVTTKWQGKLQGTSGHSSPRERDMSQVKTCIDIALRCVAEDREERPEIKDIIAELEELEPKIDKMSLYPDQSQDLIDLQFLNVCSSFPGLEFWVWVLCGMVPRHGPTFFVQKRTSESRIIAVDPSLELRFLFEPGKILSCCMQLTNKTHGRIAFNINTNDTRYKYYIQPKKGILPRLSKCYISVTLEAQEALPNMQCRDMLLVQSVNLRQGLTFDDITDDFFKKAVVEKVVEMVKLPIVYVARDRFYSTH